MATPIVASVLAALVMTAAAASAQSGTASLSGRVTDVQGSVIPGATVTAGSATTGISRSTVTNESGLYSLSALPPGVYDLTVELTGFRTAKIERLELRVDLPARADVQLEVGSLAETVTVEAESPLINTVDASLGNTMSTEQIRNLPIEARNVVQLLSLQPGAVFVPINIEDPNRRDDPRYGSTSGSRSDQQNVTLDGIDVNDPQLQTGYTSAVRVTPDALQEFRVATSNYGSEMGRSSGAQVSLVTRSGTNDYTGSAYYFARRTATSSNEYFLKLAQVASGQPSEAPKLDKDIFGGAIGGPIRRNRLFFFGNFEGLREQSESPTVRGVPSNSFRDGILMYQCAVAAACPGGPVQGFSSSHAIPAGWYGLTPSQVAALDPLGVGSSRAASEYFKQYPSPNEPGLDGRNIMDFRFAAPIENEFLTYITRLDFRISDNQSLFGRVNAQDDTINAVPQFPGQPPRSSRLRKNFGYAVGHDAVLTSSLINSFRYGLTKIDDGSVGSTNANFVLFRFISSFNGAGDGGTFTNSRETPTHNFVNDLSWLKGRHTFKTGTNIRFTRVNRSTLVGAFNSATVNPSWVGGVGQTFMPGRATCTTPGCSQVPAVAEGFRAGYADAWLNILGVMSQANLNANYLNNGQPLPAGAPIERQYASDEYEFYLQDSWQLHPTLTITGGVRYSLLSPPWETNGLQVAPTVNLGEWFAQRGRDMAAGIPSNRDPIVQFDLAGPGNNRPHFYAWDKNNFAPRVAVAWTPQGGDGFFGRMAGNGQLVIRGGYSKVFDRIGHGLATNYDAAGSFGMATRLSSPFGGPYETNPAVRFTNVTTLPPTVPAAPPGEFPTTPPLEAGVITSALDASITTPSSHMFNAVVGRQFGRNWSIEAAYVGRLGRDLMVRRDAAMAMNLTDPRSGTNYFTASQQIIRALDAAGGDFMRLGPIPFWENLFPGAAGSGRTATQSVARRFGLDAPDYITSLWLMDQLCVPSCSVFGPYAFFNRQYDSLAMLSTIGHSKYNALQLSLRKRYSAGTQFDVNYTLSKSEDLGSLVERGSAFGNFSAGGYSGFLLNSWEPELHYGLSDFDVRHQVNLNWITDLPFGQGRKFGGNATGLANQLIGDWSIAGLVRWTSGFPFNVYNCRSCWATNWNLQGNAALVDPNRLPEMSSTRNAVDGRPSPFADPEEALTFFRRLLPGEVGGRNLLRGDG
ncbi:MAG: carboxypeptidase regulatory-like domain-containing protein, partial [Vicinamibacterales bacterium]